MYLSQGSTPEGTKTMSTFLSFEEYNEQQIGVQVLIYCRFARIAAGSVTLSINFSVTFLHAILSHQFQISR